ncbi:hydantoinase/oxoprolinase family protein [Roseovarius sp.]|uniref:hydantoinase/oxoprolinase family protein n=1 Tax=Roseovarius sp. TaxID=1486281 RepID=UPI003B5A4EF8
MKHIKPGSGIEVGVDTGGTFTDIVFRFPDGTVRIAKERSTPADPGRAVIDGILKNARAWGVSLDDIERVVHGTTVATNAIIERRGARVGLITTDGFRDVLEIGRQMRRDMYDLRIQPVAPAFLVPRARRKDVPERLLASGEVLVPLDEDAVLEAAKDLVADGVRSIAVCFLFAFLNPAHELRARAIIKAAFPDLHVSLSCEIDPAIREYERTVVTVFDAYVKPVVSDYLEKLEHNLVAHGIDGPFQVIQSRGGLCSAELARQKPVKLVLSGPAGGVISGEKISSDSGRGDIITVDVGGTSSDIALIHKGRAVIRNEGTVDGYPVRVSMVDVNAIGAGGGSIAWLDSSGALRIGPHSAGADPGPACYARGGQEPTVTDASVVLGYLEPSRFAGGNMTLKPELSHEVIKTRIADPMGTSVEAAALGIHRVVNSQMAEGIRFVSIKQGFDPRGFSLIPMGGGGALHVCQLARDLGIRTILVPSRPGVMAAEGLLSAPVEHEAKRSVHWSFADTTLNQVLESLTNLDAECAVAMAKDGVPEGRAKVRHFADVCYEGQSFDLEVPFTATDAGLRSLPDAFYDLHDRVFGQSTDGPVRLVQLKSVHSYLAERGDMGASFPATAGDQGSETRSIVLPGAGRVDAAIFQRASLCPSREIRGPAIVEQPDTTLLIDLGWTGRIGDDGSLVLTCNPDTGVTK